MNRFSRLVAHTGKIFAVQQLIDGGRFSHIRFAGKYNLRQTILREISFFDRGTDKLRIMQVKHSCPLSFITGAASLHSARHAAQVQAAAPFFLP